jgi:hypothetical protein
MLDLVVRGSQSPPPGAWVKIALHFLTERVAKFSAK